jgi:hypothetical protein
MGQISGKLRSRFAKLVGRVKRQMKKDVAPFAVNRK